MYYATTWFFPISLLNFVFICFLINTADTLSSYDTTVLTHSPVAYWPLDPSIPYDYSGHNLTGVFNNSPSATTAPNGDTVSVFNGINQYFTIDDNDYLEIVRTGILTIEAWFRPDTLQFDNEEGSGYVWWMGKGAANQQSWAARMYSYNNTEGRFNRISGYAFNLSGSLGSGSYFQDNVTVGQWILYTLTINTVNVNISNPTGYAKIFKNGIERDLDPLVGYGILVQNSTAPMRIGTRQLQSYFKGAIGKVAVFDYELTSSQLRIHFNCMVNNTNCTGAQLRSTTSTTTSTTTSLTTPTTTSATTSTTTSATTPTTTSATMPTTTSLTTSTTTSLTTSTTTSVTTFTTTSVTTFTTTSVTTPNTTFVPTFIRNGSEKERLEISAICLWIVGTLFARIFSWYS